MINKPPIDGNLQAHSARMPETVLLHAGFVLTGIVNTMLGPMLPVFSERWMINDTQAGYLFTAQFTGSMFGVAGSSIFAPRVGLRFTLTLGLAIMALGTAGLAFCDWPSGLLAASCFGVGLGLTIPTVNLLVSALNPERSAAALNLINLSWGVGAVGCPLIVAALQRIHRTSFLLHGVAGMLLIVSAAVIYFHFPDPGAKVERSVARLPRQTWRSPFVPILVSIFFLYVGSEASISGWVSSYARRTMTNPGMMWAVMPSFFWVPLLLGRAIAPLLLRRIPQLKLSTGGLLLATMGIAALLASGSIWQVAVSLSLAGLGLSSVFPIAIATLSRRFGGQAPRVGGLMFAMAGLGGATLPWLVGYTSSHFESLRLGLCVPLFGCLGMVISHLLLSRQKLGTGVITY